MRPIRPIAALVAVTLGLVACSDDTTEAEVDAVTVTLLTHDSFNVSDQVFEEFTAETGIGVRVLRGGDAGSMVNQAILTRDSPQADVLYGIDNTFLSRALAADLFVPHRSEALEGVDPSLVLDPEHRVTPVDIGDVCLNFDKAGLAEAELAPPTSLDDLLDPAYRGTLVVENPATSSPGLAFLLATVAEYGEDGWQAFWADLRANDVEVTAGWEDAYYSSFSRNGGDRPLVVSYASSPPAEVVFAEEELDDAPTGVVEDSCFRQIEFAGILHGTEHEGAAGRLVDFLLSETFQADIPLNMFVYPVIDVELPTVFVDHGVRVADPYLLDAERVAEMREEWIREWTDIVLR